MRRALQIAILCLACSGVLAAQVVIDRVVATVNGQPILQSDWDLAMRCEAFLDQKRLQFTPEAAGATLQRLIDQELLLEQARTFQLKPITAEELQSRMREIRKQIPGGDHDATWQAALHGYGLTQSELDERIQNELEILRFIDVRLRPALQHVNRSDIETYYREKLLPQLKEKGAKEPPLAEVSPQIEEILSQERMDSVITELLRDLRQQSDIRMLPSRLTPEGSSAPQQAEKDTKGTPLPNVKCAPPCRGEAP